MTDREMTINWIKAYAIGVTVTLAGFAGIMCFYADALRSYGLLEGGAL